MCTRPIAPWCARSRREKRGAGWNLWTSPWLCGSPFLYSPPHTCRNTPKRPRHLDVLAARSQEPTPPSSPSIVGSLLSRGLVRGIAAGYVRVGQNGGYLDTAVHANKTVKYMLALVVDAIPRPTKKVPKIGLTATTSRRKWCISAYIESLFLRN